MKKFRTIVVVAVAIGAMLGIVAPAQAATQLGGLSVQKACETQFPGTTAVVLEHNAYGWRCRTYWSGGPVYYSGIDLSRQCRAQYSGDVYATYLNFNDPYSWRCYRR